MIIDIDLKHKQIYYKEKVHSQICDGSQRTWNSIVSNYNWTHKTIYIMINCHMSSDYYKLVIYSTTLLKMTKKPYLKKDVVQF